MATDPQFLQYVLEQAGLGAALAARRMFGEYGFYLDGRFVAVAADNQLLLKPTAEARALLPDASEAPPYPGARPWLRLDGPWRSRSCCGACCGRPPPRCRCPHPGLPAARRSSLPRAGHPRDRPTAPEPRPGAIHCQLR
ncbi:TfoX/Sxy family protein [Pseudoxanthomonas sp. SGNA-20]|uniref:TfoX/Sxy family protein n=1 Tax=Pseudoxanthomonas sp. SGNA-20 TaxID=2493088 RepID=UPI001F406975|nr:TfoX/Sxy family protein [Pseudoxanthomonas sp. SGNA-20]